MEIGVVLAAGAATRMPNKLMLWTHEGPLFTDALRYVRRHCKEVVVVVQPESPVDCYCSRFGIPTVYQTSPTGVVDSISRVCSRSVLVAFGDCYTYDNLPMVIPGCATVLFGSQPGLDGWDGTQWVSRDLPRRFSFSGAFRTDKWNPSTDDLMTEFNKLGIQPQPSLGVIDCGTPEGYKCVLS